jgi:hypothetical protein
MIPGEVFVGALAVGMIAQAFTNNPVYGIAGALAGAFVGWCWHDDAKEQE